MADEEVALRRPSKGQILTGVGIVSAILILQPVTEMFYTRNEAKAQAEQIQAIHTALIETKDELTRRLERNSDKIIERINESEARATRSMDKLEGRVERLEASRLFSKGGSKN